MSMAVAGNGHPGRRVQYAALPYRVRRDGEVQVRLITSRETRRWVIPKGWPMKGLSPAKAAAREAYEEAGLVGIVGREALGMYTYEKNLGLRSVLCDVMVFPLKVKRHLHKWPERAQRMGFWFSVDSAAAAVQEEELKLLILSFGAHMAARWAAKHPQPAEGSEETAADTDETLPAPRKRAAKAKAAAMEDAVAGPAAGTAENASPAKASAKEKVAKAEKVKAEKVKAEKVKAEKASKKKPLKAKTAAPLADDADVAAAPAAAPAPETPAKGRAKERAKERTKEQVETPAKVDGRAADKAVAKPSSKQRGRSGDQRKGTAVEAAAVPRPAGEADLSEHAPQPLAPKAGQAQAKTSRLKTVLATASMGGGPGAKAGGVAKMRAVPKAKAVVKARPAAKPQPVAKVKPAAKEVVVAKPVAKAKSGVKPRPAASATTGRALQRMSRAAGGPAATPTPARSARPQDAAPLVEKGAAHKLLPPADVVAGQAAGLAAAASGKSRATKGAKARAKSAPAAAVPALVIVPSPAKEPAGKKAVKRGGKRGRKGTLPPAPERG